MSLQQIIGQIKNYNSHDNTFLSKKKETVSSMIKILIKKVNSPDFIREGATYHCGLGSLNLYNTILLLSSELKIPESLKQYIVGDSINIDEYTDIDGNKISQQVGDKLLLLKRPFHILLKNKFIKETQYETSLQQIIGQIKNYNSHDNT